MTDKRMKLIWRSLTPYSELPSHEMSFTHSTSSIATGKALLSHSSRSSSDSWYFSPTSCRASASSVDSFTGRACPTKNLSLILTVMCGCRQAFLTQSARSIPPTSIYSICPLSTNQISIVCGLPSEIENPLEALIPQRSCIRKDEGAYLLYSFLNPLLRDLLKIATGLAVINPVATDNPDIGGQKRILAKSRRRKGSILSRRTRCRMLLRHEMRRICTCMGGYTAHATAKSCLSPVF